MRGAVAFALCAAVVAAEDEASSRLLDDDPAVRAAAAEEIGKRGPAAAPAVPQLIELVYDDFDAPSKAAIVALGRIGPDAREARPFLVDRSLGRGDFGPAVAQALVRIGPPDADAPLVAWLRAKGAVPAGPCTLEDLAKRKTLQPHLLEALGQEHALVVAQAARLLGPAARTNEAAATALVRLLDHPSACVRLNAGAALSGNPFAEAAFGRMLEDKDAKRRRVAARFLRGGSAMPQLRRALDDPDTIVRHGAVGGFSTPDVRANPGLVAELATVLDRDPLLCAHLSSLLGSLGADAAPAVPAFARCLASADPDVRWSACYALGRIGEHAGPAAVPLAMAAYDEREQVSIAAIGALTALGPAARDAAPYLAELSEADLSLGPQARRTLAAIGAGVPLPPLPDPAELPALLAELEGDGKPAGRAAFAIGRLAAKDPETLEALGAALSHPSPYARKHAALALQRIGPSSLPLIASAGAGPDPGRRLAAGTLIHFAGVAPDDLVPVAVGLLASDDPFVKREAIRSLGVAGTRGREAVPNLIACLRDENAEIVQVSIWALGRMRADATGAVPFLVEILDTSGDRNHALMAVQALGEIGQTAEPAIPSIVAAARAKKVGVQLFNPALEALAAMGPAGEAAVVQMVREEKGAERQYAITVLVQRNLTPPGLKEAIEEVLKDCDVQTREIALSAIRQLGPESKPSLESLLAALKAGPADTRARAQIVYGIAEAVSVADLVKMARGKDAQLRLAGFEALSMKPPSAFTDADRLQVLPLLLDALEHGDAALQAAAAAAALPNAPPKSFDERLLRLLGGRGPAQSYLARAIVALGPDVVPKLAVALSGDGRVLRDGAAIALAQFGPAARTAVPALVEAALDDPAASREFVRAILATKDFERFAALFADPRMPDRERFGEALAAAGVDALPHFDALRRHPDVATRREAVTLLGRLGDAAAPWLLEAAEDKDPSVASAALRSFGRSVPPGMAIPVLVRAVGDDALREAAVQGLSAHRLAARSALEALAADPRPKVRAAVLPILALPGQPALDLLGKSLADPDPTVRAAAAYALGRLGADAAPALPGLRTLLDDTEAPVRRAAASALGQMGTAAEAAVPDLVQMMRRGDPQDRVVAGRALASIGAAGAPALASLLSQPEESLRNAVQQALAEMGEPAVAAVAALLVKDEKTRRAAAEALARIGAPAAQTLATYLTHKDKGVRRDAAWALGTMGPNARRAVPDLIAALKDTDTQVVAQAAWALGRIGPAASDALPALQKLYDARRHRVVVADAIRSIRGGH